MAGFLQFTTVNTIYDKIFTIKDSYYNLQHFYILRWQNSQLYFYVWTSLHLHIGCFFADVLHHKLDDDKYILPCRMNAFLAPIFLIFLSSFVVFFYSSLFIPSILSSISLPSMIPCTWVIQVIFYFIFFTLSTCKITSSLGDIWASACLLLISSWS